MKHKIIINVTDNNGEKRRVLRSGQMRLPRRFLNWLFGDFTQIYLLEPGKTVESVDIKEI